MPRRPSPEARAAYNAKRRALRWRRLEACALRRNNSLLNVTQLSRALGRTPAEIAAKAAQFRVIVAGADAALLKPRKCLKCRRPFIPISRFRFRCNACLTESDE